MRGLLSCAAERPRQRARRRRWEQLGEQGGGRALRQPLCGGLSLSPLLLVLVLVLVLCAAAPGAPPFSLAVVRLAAAQTAAAATAGATATTAAAGGAATATAATTAAGGGATTTAAATASAATTASAAPPAASTASATGSTATTALSSTAAASTTAGGVSPPPPPPPPPPPLIPGTNGTNTTTNGTTPAAALSLAAGSCWAAAAAAVDAVPFPRASRAAGMPCNVSGAGVPGAGPLVPCARLPAAFVRCVLPDRTAAAAVEQAGVDQGPYRELTQAELTDELGCARWAPRGTPSDDMPRGVARCAALDGIECCGPRQWEVPDVPCVRYTGISFPTTLLLSVFLGCFGADRCYAGHCLPLGVAKGLTLGALGVWYIVDIILLTTGSIDPGDGSTWETFF